MALLLLISFFLPWVNWADAELSGYHMAAGRFFQVSESKFGLANPFPALNFATAVFWLIPVLAVIIICLFLARRNPGILPGLTGVMALSLATMYILFTETLVEQAGVVKSLLPALRFGIYATIVAGVGIILAGIRRKIGLKAALILVGPVLTWLGFFFLSSEALKDHDDTSGLRADHTVNATDMIQEFETDPNNANSKYKEKIIAVTGRVTEVEMPDDSSINIKMSVPSGSYAIFSFSDEAANTARGIRTGDNISVKGSCSGGEHSSILDVTYITFKRCVLNKQ
jgi:hypothetical protein